MKGSVCVLILSVFTILALAYDFESGVVPAKNPAYDEKISKRNVYFAGIAYSTEKSVSTWSCDYCRIVSPQFKSVTYMYNATTNNYGYIGYDPIMNQIVIGYRGSANVQNWLQNLDFFSFVPFPGHPTAKMHSGFFKAYTSLKGQMITGLRGLISANPSASILATGHSLGGAMAAILALDLKYGVTDLGMLTGAVNKPVKLWTYGAPRIGNKPLSELTIAAVVESFRVTHNRDPVPRVPPRKIGEEPGWWHQGQEIFYNEANSHYKVCDTSGEDPSCIISVLVPTSIKNHLYYLNVTL